MIKNFDDVNVDFYYCGNKVSRDSKMYTDAFRTISEVATKMWDAEPCLENWIDELGINYCGSLVDIIDCHVFVYLVNRLARQRCLGFVMSHERPIAVVEGGDDRQDHWMIDLSC